MTDIDQFKEEEIFPCSICGRKFIHSSLIKHEEACKKLQKMHRKVFDSGKQRSIGSDVPINDIRKVQKEKDKYGGTFPRPKTSWQQRHNDFINAISVSKNVKEPLKNDKPLSVPINKTIPDDYVLCNYCNKKFNNRAAEKHILFCKEQKIRRNNFQINNSLNSRSLSSSRLLTSTKSNKEKQFNLTNQLIKNVPPTSSSIFTTRTSSKNNYILNNENLVKSNNKQQKKPNNTIRTQSASKLRNSLNSTAFHYDEVDIDGVPLSTTNDSSNLK